MRTLTAALVAPILTVLIGASMPALSQNAVAFDLNHTTTNFSAKHLLISTVQGNIPVKSATLTLGENNIPASVEAVMDVTRIDSRNDRRDEDLRSERFLDVAQFPEMTFKSTKITRQSGNNFTMNGNLTIRGVTRPVVVNGLFEGSIKDSKGRTHIGYSANTTIDRRDFNIGTTIPAAIVGYDISITIEAEAIL